MHAPGDSELKSFSSEENHPTTGDFTNSTHNCELTSNIESTHVNNGMPCPTRDPYPNYHSDSCSTGAVSLFSIAPNTLHRHRPVSR